MVEKILATLAAFAIAVISGMGYFGIVLLMAIESACIPLPSEIIMPFAGYLVSTGRFELFAAATAGAIGCNLGSIVAYEIGRHGGRPLAEKSTGRTRRAGSVRPASDPGVGRGRDCPSAMLASPCWIPP